MISSFLRTLPPFFSRLFAALKRAFDATATWVTQLSWWKFFLFACIVMLIGNILQESLFSQEPTAVVNQRHADANADANANADTSAQRNSPGNDTIDIDESGVHINSSNIPSSTNSASAPAASPSSSATAATSNNKQTTKTSHSSSVETSVTHTDGRADIHINLPPEVGKEVGAAINQAVDDEAAQKVAGYRKKSSDWFMNFVVLLVVCLFGMKALMGGKKRAEAQALAATAAAEREALQRQVSEAKMHMMQAQVEPHFLFNTLASVEHLIETDPPRAAAMQRSLIQYLRAVLPQMRGNASVTSLGSEADMVRTYLDLLQMRMEERLTTDFQIPNGLRSAAFPPMMLQSLVENAIKHGLEAKETGGTLRVAAEVAHNKLRVTVADDGMGFGVVPSTSTGLGLQSIRERLTLLHGNQAQLIIVPNSPSGVCSTIEVPYQLARIM